MGELSCAICPRSVAPDDLVAVDKDRVEDGEVTDREEYVLHEECAAAVFAGWAEL